MTRNRPVPELSPEDRAFVQGLLVHEDPVVLAFNKPAGLACQTRGRCGNTLDHLLWAFARSNGKRPHLVHRLDRETSGIIVAARTKPAAAALHAAFEGRRVRKTYLAIVEARVPPPASGRIAAPLADRRDGALVYSAVVADGAKGARTAETGWRRLAAAEGAALVEVTPRTGRMHQIRVHLAHVGLPILGDRQYGGAAGAGANRTLLHALSLDFPTPEGGRRQVCARPPEDFCAAAAALGLAHGLEAAWEAG